MGLEDGTVFHGVAVGARGTVAGEVVFNTAMTGYQEILTDPSYARQLVTLTYPHVGNTGANADDEESRRIFCSGLIIRDLACAASNFRSQAPLGEYLQSRGAVAIGEIDTRALTRRIRERGAMAGCIVSGDGADARAAVEGARAFPGLAGMDLAREVTVAEPYAWSGGGFRMGRGYREAARARYRVVAYDFGVKRNILRMLADRGCAVTVVPAATTVDAALAYRPHGVFLSNGPGDPEPCGYAVDAIRAIVDRGVPVFGICLGHQLLALASGAKTMKMKFGHHGANHPVQDLATGRIYITSQNHGFAVSDQDLPDVLEVTHRSLFDGTIQGLRRRDRAAFSFQGHPEASPGPHDVGGLFDGFIRLMESLAAA